MKARAALRIPQAFLAFALAANVGACAGAKPPPRPEVVLSLDPEAAQLFAALQARWAGGTRPERSRMGQDLAAYLQRFPEDPTARIVRVWLAWLALEAEDLDQAEGRLQRVEKGAPGVAFDLAQAARVALLRRRGQLAEALALGLPLVGRLLDARDREQLREELLLAALDSRQEDLAVELLAGWVGDPEPANQRRFLVRWRELLPSLPDSLLVRLLGVGGAKSPVLLPAEARVGLTRRLAGSAVDRNDASLAQALLRSAPADLKPLEALGLARLGKAVLSQRLHSRTVGLLLHAEGELPRRAGAEFMGGFARGLGLPDPQVRLLLREALDAPGSIEGALRELVAEGAAVLVGGLSPAHAAEVRTFAAAHDVPVVLLPPSAPAPFEGAPAPLPSAWAFVLTSPSSPAPGPARPIARTQGSFGLPPSPAASLPLAVNARLGAELGELLRRAWTDLPVLVTDVPLEVRRHRMQLREALSRATATSGLTLRGMPALPPSAASPQTP